MAKNNKGRKPISPSQYEDKRREILEAARRLFVDKGYKGVSMRGLAREIDMSPMSIYRYFENKRAILVHLWAEVFEQLFANCHKRAGACDKSVNAIQVYGICFITYWIDNPENYLMVYGEVDTPAKAEQFFAQSDLVSDELHYIQNTFEEAGVNPAKSELACQQFLCVLHGISLSIVTIPEINWDDPSVLISGLISGIIAQNS